MSIRGGKIISTAVTIVGILLSLALVIIGLKMGVFTSPETLQIFLRGAGLWAPLIFVGIQVVQVVFPYHSRRADLCGWRAAVWPGVGLSL